MEVTAGTYTTVLVGLAVLCAVIAGIIVVLYRMEPKQIPSEQEAAYG